MEASNRHAYLLSLGTRHSLCMPTKYRLVEFWQEKKEKKNSPIAANSAVTPCNLDDENLGGVVLGGRWHVGVSQSGPFSLTPPGPLLPDRTSPLLPWLLIYFPSLPSFLCTPSTFFFFLFFSVSFLSSLFFIFQRRLVTIILITVIK